MIKTVTLVQIETRTGWVYYTDGAEVIVDFQPYQPRVSDIGGYYRYLFDRNSTIGAGGAEAKPLTLINNDRALDTLHRTVDGRSIIILEGTADQLGRAPKSLSSYTVVFRGRVEVLEYQGDFCVLRILSRHDAIAEELITDVRFDGSATSGGAGVGGPPSLAGKPVPILVGHRYNVEAVFANPYDLICQISQGWVGHSAVISYVRDRGVNLTAGTQETSLADLINSAETSSISASEYNYYSGDDGTWFALGSVPDGTVTWEATEGGGRTTAEVAQFILARSSELNDTNVLGIEVMNALAPGESGVYAGAEDTTLGTLLNVVLEGIGYWHDDLNNLTVTVGALTLPTSSVQTIEEWEVIGDIELIPSSDVGGGSPIQQVTIGYRPNNIPFIKSDLDTTVAAPAALDLSVEWLLTTPAVVDDWETRNPLAQSLLMNTALRNRADAEIIRNRQRDLRATGIDIYRVTLPTSRVTADVSDGVTITNRRFGLNETLCGVLGRDTSGRNMDNISLTELIIWRPSP